MKTIQWVLLLIVLATMTTGCMSRAIKEGFSVATGPKGFYAEDPSMGPEEAKPLAKYNSFKIGEFNSSFRNTPPELLRLVPTELRKKLTEEGLPLGPGGATCVINGTVIYYEKAGLSGQLFGPFEEAVFEVQLVDQASGQVIGQAICVGRSTTTARQGVENKAIGVAKGIAKWIEDRYPQPETK